MSKLLLLRVVPEYAFILADCWVGILMAQACSGPNLGPGQTDAVPGLVSIVDNGWKTTLFELLQVGIWEPMLQGRITGQEEKLIFTMGLP